MPFEFVSIADAAGVVLRQIGGRLVSSRIMTFVGFPLAFSLSSSSFAQDDIVIFELKPGDRVVEGLVPQAVESLRIDVLRGVETIDRDDYLARGGSFRAALRQPLEGADKVIASTELSGRQLRSEATVPSPPPAIAPELRIIALFEGARQVRGFLGLDGTGTADKVAVAVYPDSSSDFPPLERATAVPENGEFTVNLSNALEVGQRMVVHGVKDGASSEATVDVLPAAEWGRLTATFTMGVILSKDNEEFSQTDPYLDFYSSTTWVNIWAKKDHRLARSAGITGFINVRLTTIPVSQGTGTKEAEANVPKASVDTVLASKKTGIFQGGLFIPVALSRWVNRQRVNAVFAAPVFKGGFQTLAEAAIGVSTAGDGDQAGGLPAGASNTIKRLEEFSADNFFPFWAVGARLGHLKLADNGNVSPELLSYLDITWGHWDNLDFGETDPRLRLGLEGRIKMPRVPLHLGLDLNYGRGDHRDDFRIFFATKFDIGRLLQKVAPID